MRKLLKPIGYVLFLVLVLIQFFRPEKNISASKMIPAKDISALYAVPANVQLILERSCYDCHSNNTRYPWYANIQPVAWWLNDHVQEGKKELNFNEFSGYRIRRQYRKLEETIKEIKEDEMPLSSYTLIHGEADLTQAQKLALTSWASAIMDTIKATYPPDSLVRKAN